MTKSTENVEDLETNTEKDSQVDENLGICFSSGIKIYDPNTTEILIQIRGDN
jgi:hypothetical protein